MILEALSTVIGGPQSRQVAEAILDYCIEPHRLFQVTPLELERNVRGVGRATARRILAALDLSAEMQLLGNDRPYLDSPRKVFELVYSEMNRLENEELWVILLDARNRLIGISKLYKGSLNSSQVRTGETLRDAIRINAAAIILVHNHPSGDPTPSPDDIALTSNIAKAGTIMDIEVLDHLVIGRNSFCSLKERGLGNLIR